MKKFMMIFGYISAALGLLFAGYLGGYSVGSTPTTEESVEQAKYEAETQKVSDDLITVTTKYEELYNLCESKYQTALEGDVDTALRINGQMDAVSSQIDEILVKYEDEGSNIQP